MTLLALCLTLAGCGGGDDNGVTPSPTPAPTASPTATPTPEPTPTASPMPSPTPSPFENVSYTFTDVVNASIETTPFTNRNLSTYEGGIARNRDGYDSVVVVAHGNIGGGTDEANRRSVSVTLFKKNGVIATGDVYDAVSASNDANYALLTFYTSQGFRLYGATGGTATVVNRTDATVTVNLRNVRLTPVGTEATGSLTINGEVFATLTN